MGLFLTATIGFATHNTDRANRDRAAARALAAADAGLDAAIYRMNKALISSQVQGILGVATGLLAEARCVNLDIELGEIVVESPINGWCEATQAEEAIDGGVVEGEQWSPATFSYRASTDIGVLGDTLIERRIVSTGRVGDLTKRVMGTVHLTLGSGGNLLSVFEQIGYEECTATPPDVNDPDSGCT